MGEPYSIHELTESGPYTGAGPHDVPSSIAAPNGFRATAEVHLILVDTDTGDMLYAIRGCITIPSDGVAVLADETELYAAPGWSASVTTSVSVTAGEIKGSITVPSGHTFKVTFRAEGVAT